MRIAGYRKLLIDNWRSVSYSQSIKSFCLKKTGSQLFRDHENKVLVNSELIDLSYFLEKQWTFD